MVSTDTVGKERDTSLLAGGDENPDSLLGFTPLRVLGHLILSMRVEV